MRRSRAESLPVVQLPGGTDWAEQSPSPRAAREPATSQDFDEAPPLVPAAEEHALRRLLELFRGQRALVKTCKNDGWDELFEKLSGPRTRTPVTFLPADGKGMRLFCEMRRAACALIWDVGELDLSDAFIWPSGYFAKTEFNIDKDGRLLQGREEFLVTFDDLRAANEKKEFFDHNTGKVLTVSVMPYNEVLVGIHGGTGLVGVMARTKQLKHLLLAMGVRDHLAMLLPNLGSLPIVLHDPESGVQAFPLSAQLELLQYMLRNEVSHPLRYPLNLMELEAMSGTSIAVLDQLRFHGMYGITKESLLHLADAVSGKEGGTAASPKIVARKRYAESVAFALLALEFAVAADNALSTKAAFRVIAPLIYQQESLSARHFVAAGRSPLRSRSGSSDVSGDDAYNGQIYDNDFEIEEEDSDASTSLPQELCNADSSITLKSLMARAGDREVRTAIGACMALEFFHSGRSGQKIAKGIKLFQEWLAAATSLRFRLKSHTEEGRSWTELGDFINDRIFQNRKHFLDTLHSLQAISDHLEFFKALQELVALLLHPCLRLQVLQSILGLDPSYSRDMIADVVALVYEIVREMHGST